MRRPAGNGKTSHFFVYSWRANHDPHHTWHGDRGGPDHFRIPLTFLIRPVVSLLGAIENFKENAPIAGKMLISSGAYLEGAEPAPPKLSKH